MCIQRVWNSRCKTLPLLLSKGKFNRRHRGRIRVRFLLRPSKRSKKGKVETKLTVLTFKQNLPYHSTRISQNRLLPINFPHLQWATSCLSKRNRKLLENNYALSRVPPETLNRTIFYEIVAISSTKKRKLVNQRDRALVTANFEVGDKVVTIIWVTDRLWRGRRSRIALNGLISSNSLISNAEDKQRSSCRHLRKNISSILLRKSRLEIALCKS